jgi:hypothetical protein
MTLKALALAAALTCAFAPAFAADQSIDLSSGEASFIGTAPVLDGGDDLITFVNLAAGTYDFVFTLSSQFITSLVASINGQSATVDTYGIVSFAHLESTGDAPFALTLSGIAGQRAAYSGELSVTPTAPVPEPQTYALMLAGLGVMGILARRRRAD